MYIKKCKLFILFCLVAVLSAASSAWAVTSTGSLGVGLTIPNASPAPPSGGGGGGSSTTTAPTISSVISDANVSTSTVRWNVVPGSAAISNVTFAFSTDFSYSQTTTVVAPYSVLLQNLSAGTTYNFKITATDTNQKTATALGQFSTLAPSAGPVISGITISTTQTNATIHFTTNVPTYGQILYGLGVQYGSASAIEQSTALVHSITISNLVAGTTYHAAVVATDDAGTAVQSADQTFTTRSNVAAPPNVSNVVLIPNQNSFTLTWTNPNVLLVPDFAGVKIVRTTGAPASGPLVGSQVYSGAGSSVTDSMVSANTVYFYTLFSFNNSNLFSSGVSVNGQLSRVAPVCDTVNGAVNCSNPACASNPACVRPPATSPEICDNGVDDDANGQVDCADSACVGAAVCTAKTPNETKVPETTVNPAEHITAGDLRFFTGQGKINLSMYNDSVSNLAGAGASVFVNKNILSRVPQNISFVVDGEAHHMRDVGTAYEADFSFPVPGDRSAYVDIEYAPSERDVVAVTLRSLSWGVIVGDEGPLDDAVVQLMDSAGRVVDTAVYGIANPLHTSVGGGYGWTVPNGSYAVLVTKTGYKDFQSDIFAVANNVVNYRFTLISIPPKLLEDVSATSTLGQNARTIGKNALRNITAISKQASRSLADTVSTVQEYVQSPEVQNSVSNRILPSVVGVTAVGTLAAVSWADIVPFLRFLFLQPLMLIGRRRRAKWGQVYNTLSKLPVDLATVRLLDARTNRVLQTRVTDGKGRFAFITQPGTYRLLVVKNNFNFPSDLLKGFTEDGIRTDIYHGENIIVTEKDVVIAANIPLDPLGSTAKPRRVYWQIVGRTAQTTLSLAGLLITVASLLIAPRWYVFVLAALHLALLLVFRRLALPPKIKSWGIVYDATTRAPLGRTVARLFSLQFNKLVDSQITDSRGRYYFLAGDNRYYVTYDHPGYVEAKSDAVDLSGKEEETINLDVGMRTGDRGQQ